MIPSSVFCVEEHWPYQYTGAISNTMKPVGYGKKTQLDVDIEPTFKICTYEIHPETNGHAQC